MEYTLAQKVVIRQIKHATNWITGGHENSIADGHMDASEMPTREELAAEIYEGIMENTYDEGCLTFRPTKEIRFCGADFIKNEIERRLIKEGY